ncbi:MAG: hypothetical protein IKL73_04760 [Lachnospiraceae bacterium]|nr:hypothetical protein [Lachnospiraceae bacterium]
MKKHLVIEIILGVIVFFGGISLLFTKMDAIKWKNRYNALEEKMSIQSEENANEKMRSALIIKGYDLENKKMEVCARAYPAKVTKATKVFVNVEERKMELERHGDFFETIVTIPISLVVDIYSDMWFSFSAYEDDKEIDSAHETLNTSIAFSAMLDYKNEFYAVYGNDKLTLVGNINYEQFLDREIVDAKLVYFDKTQAIDINNYNNIEVSISEEFEVDWDIKDNEISSIYIQLETSSGEKYIIYPDFNITVESSTYNNGQSEKKYTHIVQHRYLRIETGNEKIYLKLYDTETIGNIIAE